VPAVERAEQDEGQEDTEEEHVFLVATKAQRATRK
jgi:hypothetical protein